LSVLGLKGLNFTVKRFTCYEDMFEGGKKSNVVLERVNVASAMQVD